jgi:hypothetical protein
VKPLVFFAFITVTPKSLLSSGCSLAAKRKLARNRRRGALKDSGRMVLKIMVHYRRAVVRKQYIIAFFFRQFANALAPAHGDRRAAAERERPCSGATFAFWLKENAK